MEVTKTLIVMVLITLIWSQSVYSNNELTKKSKSDTAGTELYRDNEFESQDAVLRGRLYLPENKSEKSPTCYHDFFS